MNRWLRDIIQDVLTEEAELKAENERLKEKLLLYRRWMHAYDDFVLERRDIGSSRRVADAVWAFSAEKGINLDSL